MQHMRSLPCPTIVLKLPLLGSAGLCTTLIVWSLTVVVPECGRVCFPSAPALENLLAIASLSSFTVLDHSCACLMRPFRLSCGLEIMLHLSREHVITCVVVMSDPR
jgi:hypothetical protein